MTFSALVIPPTGPARRETITGLPDLNRIVDGYIEAIPVGSRADVFMYGNEEGRIMGLPHNPRASAFAGLDVVGTVVLFGAVGSREADAPADLDAAFGLTE